MLPGPSSRDSLRESPLYILTRPSLYRQGRLNPSCPPFPKGSIPLFPSPFLAEIESMIHVQVFVKTTTRRRPSAKGKVIILYNIPWQSILIGGDFLGSAPGFPESPETAELHRRPLPQIPAGQILCKLILMEMGDAESIHPSPLTNYPDFL